MDSLVVLVIAVILFLLWRNYKTLTDILGKQGSGGSDSSYLYYNYPYSGGYGYPYGYGYSYGRRGGPWRRRWGGRGGFRGRGRRGGRWRWRR